MATYSYGQLEELWVKAGGSRVMAPLMAAIALAESGGRSDNNNYTDNGGRQTSWGLWQVSDGTHNWPGPADPGNALNNARYAVEKYKTQGLGAWGTYTSGAYKQFYRGNVPPSQLPPGGKGSGGGTQQATTTSVWTDMGGGGFPIPGFGQLIVAIQDVWAKLLGGTSADPMTAISQDISMITGLFDRLLHSVEWFFVPSHWVRMLAAGFGLLFLIPGLYALMKTGSSDTGDASLAMGILLVTLAGVCFFVAFHNLPEDVDNLRALLGWMMQSINEGKPARSAAGAGSVTA